MERFSQVRAVTVGKPRQSNLWLSGGRHGAALGLGSCSVQWNTRRQQAKVEFWRQVTTEIETVDILFELPNYTTWIVKHSSHENSAEHLTSEPNGCSSMGAKGSTPRKLPNRQGSGRDAGGGHKTGCTPASLATSSIHSSLLPSKLRFRP